MVEEIVKNIRVRCRLCAPSNKTLSGARNTTSNLRKHLNTVRKTTQLVPLTTENETQTRKRKSVGDDDEQPSQTKRQCTLSLTSSSINPSRLQGLVAEYIIEDMFPISTVESPVFSKLVCGVSSSNVQLPSRKSFTMFLDKTYDSMIAKVKGILETVERVCTAADVWSAKRRSYLGKTMHWIDTHTL